MEQENLVCCECGEHLTPDEVYEFDGSYYCRHCLDEATFVCDCCGNREYNDDEISDDRISICQSCYDTYYHRWAYVKPRLKNNSRFFYSENISAKFHSMQILSFE